MSHARAVVLLLTVILTSLCSLAQSSDGSQPAVESAANNQGSESAQDDATVKEITDQIKHVKAIQDALKGEDPDFGLVLGIGSRDGPRRDGLSEPIECYSLLVSWSGYSAIANWRFVPHEHPELSKISGRIKRSNLAKTAVERLPEPQVCAGL